MNVNRHKEWRQGVIEHYGSVDAFSDVRTIQIMLQMLQRELHDYTLTVREITDQEARDEFEEIFEEDVNQGLEFIAELETWLQKRGLEP